MNRSSEIKRPTNVKYLLGVLLALVIVGAVALVAVLLYFVNRPKPLVVGPADERRAKLAEVNAKQNEAISTYAWVDQPNGVVRIPVARAMQLTIEKLEKAERVDKGSIEDSKKDLSKD